MAEPEEETMGAFAREDIRAVLARFGISSARRAVTTDSTEEVILLSKRDFAQIDANEVTTAVMAVLAGERPSVRCAHRPPDAPPLPTSATAGTAPPATCAR